MVEPCRKEYPNLGRFDAALAATGSGGWLVGGATFAFATHPCIVNCVKFCVSPLRGGPCHQEMNRHCPRLEDIKTTVTRCLFLAMDDSLTQDMPTPTSGEFKHEELQQQQQHITKGGGIVEPRTPSASSRNTSQESLRTPTKSTPGSSEAPLRPSKRLPSSPTSTPARPSWEGHRRSLSAVPETIREKSPASILTLSDYDGSETSHTERRFLRLYEELDSHCSGTIIRGKRGRIGLILEESFPEFITPWFLRRINYGPCKAGDIVDLLRFLRPGGKWISPFEGRSMLDPFLAASLEKALYPDIDNFNPGQKALLQSLHHLIFSAYGYAQGIFFPFDKEWEADRRDVPVDALNSYVEDMIGLIEYTRKHGRETSLRDFVRERTQGLNNADRKRTFLFGEGGDTRSETEEYVYNLFLGLLGLWTVGIDTSDMVDLTFHQGTGSKVRFDCSKNLPHKETMMGDISLIRETFGVLATPLDGNGGMEWIRPLQDFDAATIAHGPFHFALTRDISRHITLDEKSRSINLFCEEAMSEGDSLSRLEGNMIAKSFPTFRVKTNFQGTQYRLSGARTQITTCATFFE